ncbi:MAG: hypothetical protein JW768_04655 [Chitinispirillaceae bacterium]|nr:hypothetical protein [Chitinispirillaceae bacterium]
MKTRVETSGCRQTDEVPVSFWIEGQRYAVIEVEDRWHGPRCLWFRVFASDARRYLLQHTFTTGIWEVEPVSLEHCSNKQ